MQSSPQKLFTKVAFTEAGPTSLSQMFTSLGLCEGGHLVELVVNARVLEAPEMDALAVNDAIRQLLGQSLLRPLWAWRRKAKNKDQCIAWNMEIQGDSNLVSCKKKKKISLKYSADLDSRENFILSNCCWLIANRPLKEVIKPLYRRLSEMNPSWNAHDRVNPGNAMEFLHARMGMKPWDNLYENSVSDPKQTVPSRNRSAAGRPPWP